MIFVQLIACIICNLSLGVNGYFGNNNRGGVTCPEPAIKNGKHDSMPSAWFIWTHPVFKVLNFVCDDGYILQGPKSARCLLSGNWTELPKCTTLPGVELTKSICKIPPIGDNVEVYPMKPAFDLRESVTFICAGVRKADELLTTHCGDDGLFNPPPPKCIEPECVRPTPPSGGYLRSNQRSYAVGEVAEFMCLEGYNLVGQQTVTCGEDGYFPYAEIKCEATPFKPQGCTKPEQKPKQFLYQSKELYAIGEAVTFFCEQGYELKGARSITCLPTKNWSRRIPYCKKTAAYCTPPANPINGYLLYRGITGYNQYPVGKIARFRCNFGYVLQGLSSIKCMENGLFSGPPPICVPNQYFY